MALINRAVVEHVSTEEFAGTATGIRVTTAHGVNERIVLQVETDGYTLRYNTITHIVFDQPAPVFEEVSDSNYHADRHVLTFLGSGGSEETAWMNRVTAVYFDDQVKGVINAEYYDGTNSIDIHQNTVVQYWDI